MSTSDRDHFVLRLILLRVRRVSEIQTAQSIPRPPPGERRVSFETLEIDADPSCVCPRASIDRRVGKRWLDAKGHPVRRARSGRHLPRAGKTPEPEDRALTAPSLSSRKKRPPEGGPFVRPRETQAIEAAERRVRKAAKPRPAKPRTIIAQVDDSGMTDATAVMLTTGVTGDVNAPVNRT